jgi:putative Mn2+ efflux pump MntP
MQMTDFYEIVIIGLVLSADSFSAAVAMGHRPFSKKEAYRFATVSGGAETVMALAGALAGTIIVSKFSSIDHWVAFALLAGVSIHMGFEGIQDLISKVPKPEKTTFHSFGKILLVSFATSLDAFSVGLGLGVAKKTILPYLFSIGVWAFLTTLVGLYLAKKLSKVLGPIMNLFGSVVLAWLAYQALKV